MNNRDYFLLSAMGGLGVWIWCRDLGWAHQYASTLPVLFSFLWYLWLVGPWQVREVQEPISKRRFSLSIFLICIGMLSDLNLLMAIGWAMAFTSWVSSKFNEFTSGKAKRLILLIVMAFPWMALDGDWVSSIFRVTAAQSAEYSFSLIGFSVERTGTNPWIQGLPVTVNEACSGLGVLQAMMIVGVVLLEAVFPHKNQVMTQLLTSILVAWIANTLRVIGISVAALTWGVEFASGPFHTWGGMAILSLVFIIAWGLIEHQSKRQDQ